MLDRLALRLPIIQAPMAGVSTPLLAAAVSNTGALGSIAIGSMTPALARAAIDETRQRTARPFNVNVFCHEPPVRDAAAEAAWIATVAPLFATVGAQPPAQLQEPYPSFRENPEVLALLLELQPAVVSFHFGLPDAAAITALRAAGIVMLATVTSTSEARAAADAGVDAVVAQGSEAGGHRGCFDPSAPDALLSTLDLVRAVRTCVQLPVIAAGGIMDGAGVRAALDAGAVAAQLGTAFICCPESAASPEHRARLLDSDGSDVTMTAAFSGRPAQGLQNTFTRFVESAGNPTPCAYPVAYDLARTLASAAAARGVTGIAAMWAGRGAGGARVLPAAELTMQLAREAGLIGAG